MLGQTITDQLRRLPFHRVAQLLYRDSVEQKHGERGRLLQELEDNKRTERSKRKAIKDQQAKLAQLNECVQMMVNHMLSVSYIWAQVNFVVVVVVVVYSSSCCLLW